MSRLLLSAALLATVPSAAFAQASPTATIQTLDAGLLSIMKSGKAAGQKGRAAAIAPVIDRAFGLGLPEVYAVVRPGNDRSMAVCRRLGMTQLGRMRRWYDVELEAFRLMAPAVVD